MPLTGLRRTEALANFPPPRGGRRLRLSIIVSFLLHAALLLLVLFTIARHKPHEEMLPPPSKVTMLFQTGSKSGPTVPHPNHRSATARPPVPARSAPPVPTRTPSAPPVSPAARQPQEKTAPGQPSKPARLPTPRPAVAPMPHPAPQAAPIAAPGKAPGTASRTNTPPPKSTLTKVRSPVSLPPPAVSQSPPLPVPPPPPVPSHVVPRVPPRPVSPPRPRLPPRQPAPPRRTAFPAPMDLTFGKPITLRHRPAAPHIAAAGPRLPGIIDMSLGPAAKGRADLTPQSDNDIKAQGADWRNALSRWVSEHAYYPDQAVQLDEEGDSTVRVTVMPDGRVKEVELVGRSGSMWLDMGLVSMFRDAHIPPLPPGQDKPFTFAFTMHYVLLPPH